MKENYANEQPGERVITRNSLDVAIVTVMAAMPFLHYVLSAAILIVTSMLILILKHTRQSVKAHMRMYSVVLAITAVSLTGSLIYGNFIGVLVTYGVFLVLTFATYARTVMNKSLFERVLLVNALGSFLQLAVVLFQRIREPNPDYRPTGFSYNANYLGSVAVLSALLAMIMLLENKSFKDIKKNYLKNALYAAALLSNALILVICESRSSLLGLMAAAFVLLLMKKQYILCAVGAACGAVIWIMAYVDPDIFGWTNSLTSMFTQRLGIWICALDTFAQNPATVLIGMGPMSYKFAWSKGLVDPKWTDTEWISGQKYLSINNGFSPSELAEYFKTANHAHNIYADTLVNVGIIGALLYIVLLRSFLRSGFKKLKAGDKTAFITTVVAVTAILVQGIPDATIMWHQSATLFVLMCASSFGSEYPN